MENKDTDTTPSTPSAGSVMDIQPPRPVTTAPPLNEAVSSPGIAIAPIESPDSEVTEAQDETQVAIQSPELPVSSSEHPVTPNPLAIPEIPAHIKKSTPIVPIVVAILIAVALAGVTVFAYLKTAEDTKTTKTTTNVPLAGQKITQSDVDAENKKLEEDLKAANEEVDFAAADLSDQSLGL